MIKLENLNKSFKKKNEKINIYEDLNIEFNLGKMYAIIGESGAGKSTLIKLLGLLDVYDSGNYYIDNIKINNLGDSELSKIRMEKIGLIFQDYYLNPRLTAYENILIATFINPDINKNDREIKVNELLRRFHLENRANHYPDELSGGEQQRICIARALINNPQYILADEPTGSLDSKNTEIVIDILNDLVKEGKCVILVTHDMNVAKSSDFIYELKNHTLYKK